MADFKYVPPKNVDKPEWKGKAPKFSFHTADEKYDTEYELNPVDNSGAFLLLLGQYKAVEEGEAPEVGYSDLVKDLTEVIVFNATENRPQFRKDIKHQLMNYPYQHFIEWANQFMEWAIVERTENVVIGQLPKSGPRRSNGASRKTV